MNKSGYASECTECGSREIKKGEPKNSINVKTMSEVTFRIFECKIVDTKNVKTLTDFKIKSLVKVNKKHTYKCAPRLKGLNV